MTTEIHTTSRNLGSNSARIRMMTVADIHQSVVHYQRLPKLIHEHQPDLVAFVGDFLGLDCGGSSKRLSIKESVATLSQLPAPLVFVRGNHEEENWGEFVQLWPHDRVPLVALNGTALKLGPLVVVGFPCEIGYDEPWYDSLPKSGNTVTLTPGQSGRPMLSSDPVEWFPRLLRQHGPAARALWLMHEPPVEHPLGGERTVNDSWREAIERFMPLITVFGHDHHAPVKTKKWHHRLDSTTCLNVGQSPKVLHYCVLDFEFTTEKPGLPSKVTVSCFPWKQTLKITGK